MSIKKNNFPIMKPAIIRKIAFDNKDGTKIQNFIILSTILVFIIIVTPFIAEEKADFYLLVFLSFFSVLGIFFIFSFILGIIKFSENNISANFASHLLNSVKEGIIVIDQDNHIVYANKKYKNLTNHIDGEDITSLEYFFSSCPEISEIIYRLTKNAHQNINASEKLRLYSGSEKDNKSQRWFQISACKADASLYGKPLMLWQICDITNDHLSWSSEFQDLKNTIGYFENSPAGFFTAKYSGEILYINKTLADWLGIDLDQCVLEQISIHDLVVGEGMAQLETVNIETDNTNIVDLDLSRSNGQNLPVKIYYKNYFDKDKDLKTIHAMVINRSINDAGEDALRASEIRFTRFFNNTPIAIASLSYSGEIIRTNAPFLKLFADVVGKNGGVHGLKLNKLVHHNDINLLQDTFSSTLTGRANKEPIDVVLASDEERSIRFFISSVVSIGENIHTKGNSHDDERVIIYAMEITEQRALQQQFNQSQKMQAIGQLAGGIAHDFNNVLTAIIGFSDLLLSKHRPGDPSFRDLMNIKVNANRAASLVRQLLAFSRRQTLRPKVLSLGNILFDLRMLLDRLLGEKINLQIIHGRDLWPVKVDISQFEQVVVNLVVNARDAMPDGGNLIIVTKNLSAEECRWQFNYKAMPNADYVLMEFSDNGTGISKEIIDKIFDPFYSTKEVGKGTGLGLSTVYGIVKQTEGFIYPESIVGKGSIFRVFLPRHSFTQENTDSQLEKIEEQKKQKNNDLSGNATILLVEDEEAVRIFSKRALMSRGYKVYEAESGVKAMELMQEFGDNIDLVISDVVMPEMDGPTLFKKIRKTHPNLKFIFISGYAEDTFAKHLIQENKNSFDFLLKPFSIKQLATTIKSMLVD